MTGNPQAFDRSADRRQADLVEQAHRGQIA
jgi:hypothetical protein